MTTTTYYRTGDELDGSTVEMMTDTGYRLTDGRFVPFTRVHPLTPATPLVVLR